MPSIVTSLGIALEFRLLDDFLKNHGPSWIADNLQTTMGTFTSGLGAHLTWTLPFGLLVMFAIFNRFDNRFEEAARDHGATPWQTLRYVILPIILPSVIGVGLFGFTLSWDEIARSSQAMGEHNTLPMELQALTTTVTTPEIYALGTATTGVSFAVIAVALLGDHDDPRPPVSTRLRRRPGVRPSAVSAQGGVAEARSLNGFRITQLGRQQPLQMLSVASGIRACFCNGAVELMSYPEACGTPGWGGVMPVRAIVHR